MPKSYPQSVHRRVRATPRSGAGRLGSVLKSPIATRGSSRVVRWLRLRHSARNLRLNDSMNALFHGALGGI